MTIRTFWTIAIKFLGLWLVFDFFSVAMQFISSLISIKGDTRIEETAMTIFLLLLTVGIYVFILRLFVFKTSWLIDKLHLDKGFFEEKIDLNISSKTILSIATIVIGGILIVESLPNFCKQVFVFFQQKNIFRENPTSGWIIFHFVKIIIGYILLTNSKFIAGFIDKKAKNESENND
jgi:hypothetical protein